MTSSSIVDCFSYLGAGHPLLRGSPHGYVVAPNPDEGLDACAAFPHRVKEVLGARTGGALLPVIGPTDAVFAAATMVPGWSALLLTNVWAADTLDSALVRERLSQPELQSLPILVEAGLEGFSRPDALRACVEAFPGRAFVLAHGGQLNISGAHLHAARDIFATFPNTYAETSGIYRQDFLEDLLGLLGPDRILYGSGFPRMDERLEIERVRILPVSPGHRARMLGQNARLLFGLG